MKSLGSWLQPVSHRLVAWLTSKWGASLVLIGTLALAASTAAYLTSASDHQAREGGSVADTVIPVPAQSLDMPQWRIGDPCPPVSTPASAPLCWSAPGTATPIPAQPSCNIVVLGDAPACTGMLPAVPAQSLCTTLMATGALTLPAQCTPAAPVQSLCSPQGVFDGYDITGEVHPSPPGHCALLW
jgi:hypothetical protein